MMRTWAARARRARDTASSGATTRGRPSTTTKTNRPEFLEDGLTHEESHEDGGNTNSARSGPHVDDRAALGREAGTERVRAGLPAERSWRTWFRPRNARRRWSRAREGDLMDQVRHDLLHAGPGALAARERGGVGGRGPVRRPVGRRRGRRSAGRGQGHRHGRLPERKGRPGRRADGQGGMARLAAMMSRM